MEGSKVTGCMPMRHKSQVMPTRHSVRDLTTLVGIFSKLLLLLEARGSSVVAKTVIMNLALVLNAYGWS